MTCHWRAWRPRHGVTVSRVRSRISSASSSWRNRLSALAICRGSSSARQSPQRLDARAPTMWLRVCPRAPNPRWGGGGGVGSGLASGLDTQLGATWPGGAELSFGQWQKLALARGFMRDRPLLLILDEPTAALDAETEHALFDRYAAAARDPHVARDGRITILVSHRFSTVRMADLIVVRGGARLADVGTHDELMSRGGQYAQLYRIQAAAYR